MRMAAFASFSFLLIALALLLPLQHAASAILNPSGPCAPFNTTLLACRDGYPITVSFSVSAPYPLFYGSFTVMPADTTNVSEAVDSFGNQCSLQSGSTQTCSVNLKPIPLLQGNGTIKKTVLLRLRSTSYPQIVFNDSFNISIYHYLDQNESIFIRAYNQTFLRYEAENESYSYFCGVYGICNSQVGYGIALSGSYLAFSYQDASQNLLSNAYYNVSVANSTLSGEYGQYSAFVNQSNKILQNWVSARYQLANDTNKFNANEAALAKCGIATNIADGINNTAASSMPTTLNGSANYKGKVANFTDYEDGEISRCLSGSGVSSATGFISSIEGNSIYLILIVVIIIVLVYAVLRFRSHREVKRIREEAVTEKAHEALAEKKDDEKRHGEQPEAEAGAEGPKI